MHLKQVQFLLAGAKPYSCSICGEKFTDRSSRKRHEREHGGQKSYVCQLCGDSFTRAGHLKTHLKKRHTADQQAQVTLQIQYNSIFLLSTSCISES